MVHKGIAGFCAAEETHIFGIIIVFTAPAESDNFFIKALDGFHCVGVVAVHNNGAGAVGSELPEGFYGIFDGAEIVKVVVVDVKNYRNVIG